MESVRVFFNSIFGIEEQAESPDTETEQDVKDQLMRIANSAKKLIDLGRFDPKIQPEISSKLTLISGKAMQLIEEQNFDAELTRDLRSELLEILKLSVVKVVNKNEEQDVAKMHFLLKLEDVVTIEEDSCQFKEPRQREAGGQDVCEVPRILGITVISAWGAECTFELPVTAKVMELKMMLAKKVKTHPINYITLKCGDVQLKNGCLADYNLSDESVLQLQFNKF